MFMPITQGGHDHVYPDITLTYRGNNQISSAATTFTHASAALGTANIDRSIAVSVLSNNSSVTLNSVTIAGISAVKVADNDGANRVKSIWLAAVPTGTTGSIVCTYSGNQDQNHVAWYELHGASATLEDTALGPGSGNVSITIDVADGGAVIGAIMPLGSSSTPSCIWNGLTEHFDFQGRAAPYYIAITGASAAFATGETGKTITATLSAAAHPTDFVFASFKPGRP